MFQRIASLTGMTSLTMLGWLLSAGPAAAQNQGYSVWANAHGSGGSSSWGSGGGWRSRSYFIPRSTTSYYYAPAFTASAPVTRSASYYAPAETAPVNDRVTLNLFVPADAKIRIQDSLMALGGRQRQFVSPPIEPGSDYTYDIQVNWMQDGREVTSKRHINVHAGDVINLTFSR